MTATFEALVEAQQYVQDLLSVGYTRYACRLKVSEVYGVGVYRKLIEWGVL